MTIVKQLDATIFVQPVADIEHSHLSPASYINICIPVDEYEISLIIYDDPKESNKLTVLDDDLESITRDIFGDDRMSANDTVADFTATDIQKAVDYLDRLHPSMKI